MFGEKNIFKKCLKSSKETKEKIPSLFLRKLRSQCGPEVGDQLAAHSEGLERVLSMSEINSMSINSLAWALAHAEKRKMNKLKQTTTSTTDKNKQFS